jgi:predicted secreted protein with PEFG-CTERM motif
LRNSEYTFVILQGGKEIHRTTGLAQVGGESEDYYFTEKQTGPTIIRFENIRNTGQETEFGIVVAPEFGSFTIVILTISIMTIIIISKKNSFLIKNF